MSEMPREGEFYQIIKHNYPVYTMLEETNGPGRDYIDSMADLIIGNSFDDSELVANCREEAVDHALDMTFTADRTLATDYVASRIKGRYLKGDHADKA